MEEEEDRGKLRFPRKSLRRPRGRAGEARRTSAGTALACWDQRPAPSGGTGGPSLGGRACVSQPYGVKASWGCLKLFSGM